MVFEIFGFGTPQTATKSEEPVSWNGRSISRWFSGAAKIILLSVVVFSVMNQAEAVNSQLNPINQSFTTTQQYPNYSPFQQTENLGSVEKALELRKAAESIETSRTKGTISDFKKAAGLWKEAGDALEGSRDFQNPKLGIYTLNEYRLNCYTEADKLYERYIFFNSASGGNEDVDNVELALLSASIAEVYLDDENPVACSGTNRFREGGNNAGRAALWYSFDGSHKESCKWREIGRKSYLESAKIESEPSEKRATDYYHAATLAKTKKSAKKYLNKALSLSEKGGDAYKLVKESLQVLATSIGKLNPLEITKCGLNGL